MQVLCDIICFVLWSVKERIAEKNLRRAKDKHNDLLIKRKLFRGRNFNKKINL